MRSLSVLVVLIQLSFVECVIFTPSCTFNGVSFVNSYYPGVSSSTDQVLIDTSFFSPPSVGDVIMIIQTQNGTIIETNTSDYGGDDGSGSGFTSSGNAGAYDFNVITSVTPTNGNIYTLDLQFSLSYHFTSGNGLGKFQVLVVHYCGDTIITGTPPIFTPWNGEYGGVVALISHNLTFDTSIDMKGFGFRGGDFSDIFTSDSGGGTFKENYADDTAGTVSVEIRNSFKGEGFIGSPRLDGNPSTYPSGLDSARGSPGNAGGGGNFRDSGGGGGSNGGSGGDGGSFSSNTDFPYPGIGAIAAPVSETNLFFGL